MRQEKSYNGKMMEVGKRNEEIVMGWLKKQMKEVLDFREFKLTQRIDVDCGVETMDGNIVLAEIKQDKWIGENGNLCFECNRINHFAEGKWFYLGWGWRSPAQKLIVRNGKNGETFVFDFNELRKFIGGYIAVHGKNIKINITETDNQKTTFNYLIPMKDLKKIYKKFIVL